MRFIILLFALLIIFSLEATALSNITITSPLNTSNILNTLSVTLNLTFANGFNSSSWYSWNNGYKNYTLCLNCNTSGNKNWTTITFPRSGIYNLSLWSNNSAGTITTNSSINLFFGNYTAQLSAESYIATSGWLTPENIYDNSWSTSGYDNSVAGIPNLYINYSNLTLLTNKNIYNYLWEVKDQSEQINLTIPSNCINGYNASLVVNASYTNPGTVNWACYNYSSFNYIPLRTSSGGYANGDRVYEETLHYFYYDNNLIININNDLQNNSNFLVSLVNFTFNVSDDNDYILNASLYLDEVLNTTSYVNQWINTSLTTTLNFTVNNIADGTHTWYIKAYDSDGVSNTSLTNTITIDTVSCSCPASSNWVISKNCTLSSITCNLGNYNLSIVNPGHLTITNSNLTVKHIFFPINYLRAVIFDFTSKVFITR